MKKLVALLLSLCLVMGMLAVASAGTYTPGTYEGTGKGYGETVKVTVKVTVDEEKITAVEITGDEEVPFGQPQFDAYAAAVVEKQSADIDAVAGATMTRDGVKEAVENALAAARGEEKAAPAGDIAFTAGTYEATADGYNGVVTGEVTFSDTAVTDIKITGGMETKHVGDVAFDIMIPEMIEVNGSGVDGVSGATFSSRALRNIVNSAAEQAENSWWSNLINSAEEKLTGTTAKFEDALNRLMEALAVMIVTNCIIPIVVLLFFVWLVKTVLNLDVNLNLAALRRK